MHISEALQMQIEVQRRLHEQQEVQVQIQRRLDHLDETLSKTLCLAVRAASLIDLPDEEVG